MALLVKSTPPPPTDGLIEANDCHFVSEAAVENCSVVSCLHCYMFCFDVFHSILFSVWFSLCRKFCFLFVSALFTQRIHFEFLCCTSFLRHTSSRHVVTSHGHVTLTSVSFALFLRLHVMPCIYNILKSLTLLKIQQNIKISRASRARGHGSPPPMAAVACART